MGEWTWLHTVFPEADIVLTQTPIQASDANVLVRTVRRLPPESDRETETRFEVRVAPHNVAPFRGGPWLHRFGESALAQPGEELRQFCAALAAQLRTVRKRP